MLAACLLLHPVLLVHKCQQQRTSQQACVLYLAKPLLSWPVLFHGGIRPCCAASWLCALQLLIVLDIHGSLLSRLDQSRKVCGASLCSVPASQDPVYGAACCRADMGISGCSQSNLRRKVITAAEAGLNVGICMQHILERCAVTSELLAWYHITTRKQQSD